jgi:hypothetical protein
MKLKFSIPKKDPTISIEAEVTEQQIMGGFLKFVNFIKEKLPFKIEVDKDGGTHQD